MSFRKSELEILNHILGDKKGAPGIIGEAIRQAMEEHGFVQEKAANDLLKKKAKSIRDELDKGDSQLDGTVDPNEMSQILIQHSLLSEFEWTTMVSDVLFLSRLQTKIVS